MIDPRLIILQPTPYCNINCSYCYLNHRDDKRLMSQEVVEALREKIFCRLPPQSAPIVVWHAGEPTAAPIEWYEYATVVCWMSLRLGRVSPCSPTVLQSTTDGSSCSVAPTPM